MTTLPPSLLLTPATASRPERSALATPRSDRATERTVGAPERRSESATERAAEPSPFEAALDDARSRAERARDDRAAALDDRAEARREARADAARTDAARDDAARDDTETPDAPETTPDAALDPKPDSAEPAATDDGTASPSEAGTTTEHTAQPNDASATAPSATGTVVASTTTTAAPTAGSGSPDADRATAAAAPARPTTRIDDERPSGTPATDGSRTADAAAVASGGDRAASDGASTALEPSSTASTSATPRDAATATGRLDAAATTSATIAAPGTATPPPTERGAESAAPTPAPSIAASLNAAADAGAHQREAPSDGEPRSSRDARTPTPSATAGTNPAEARAAQVQNAVQLENATGQDARPVTLASERNASDHATTRAATHANVERTPTDASSNTARLVRGMSTMVNQRGGAMTMRLMPATLGEVRVQMVVSGGSVTVDLTTTNQHAQQAIERSIVALRTALESHGLSVERLGVQTAEPSGRTESTTGQHAQHGHAERDASGDAGDGRSRGRYDGDGAPTHREHAERESRESAFTSYFDPAALHADAESMEGVEA